MTGALVGPTRRLPAALAWLLAVVAAVAASLASDRPPRPAPAAAPAEEFSAERALDPLAQLATEPRPLGSAASDRARDYLTGALRAEGFSVRIDRAIGANSAEGTASFGRVDNIVATLPGRAPTGKVVLAAHYDSVAAGPGASDDGAALAAMLETVRALRPRDRLRNDLVLLVTDGEEDGLLGAAAFARKDPFAGRRAVVLNWEARGASGPSLMFETSRANARLVELFARSAPHPHGDSALVELYRLLPNDTDFTELTKAGLLGMNFAYIEDGARYHTPGDSIANLDRSSLQHHGANMLALTRALGDADLRTLGSDHDAVYFRVFGLLIAYSTALVWPLALLAGLALVVLVALARRRRLVSIPRLLLAAVSVVLALAAAAVAAQGLWWVLAQTRPGYSDSGADVDAPALFRLAVGGVAAVVLVVWYLLLRRRIGPAALACGAMAWPALLGVLTASSAPGTSHLFALPALFWATGGLVAWLVPRPRSAWPVVAMAVGALPAVGLLLPLATSMFDAVGIALAGVAAALLVLFGLALVPLLELFLAASEERRDGRAGGVLVATLGLTMVLALTGAGLVLHRPDPEDPHQSHLAYVLDADTSRASWVSRDAEPNEWSGRYVSERSVDNDRLPPGVADGPVWTGPALSMRARAPEITLRSRHRDAIALHVSSPRSATAVTLRVDQRVEEVTVAARGLAPATVAVGGSRRERWRSEIRFGDLPAAGIDLTLRVPHAARLRIAAFDETQGLRAVPGFMLRPHHLERSSIPDSDVLIVSRTSEF